MDSGREDSPASPPLTCGLFSLTSLGADTFRGWPPISRSLSSELLNASRGGDCRRCGSAQHATIGRALSPVVASTGLGGWRAWRGGGANPARAARARAAPEASATANRKDLAAAHQWQQRGRCCVLWRRPAAADCGISGRTVCVSTVTCRCTCPCTACSVHLPTMRHARTMPTTTAALADGSAHLPHACLLCCHIKQNF